MVAFEAIHSVRMRRAFRKKHLFNPLARPGRFAQKGQTRLDCRMMAETANGHTCTQYRPSVPCDQGRDDGFQCDSVQGITGMRHGVRLIHRWCRHEEMQGTDCGRVSQVALAGVTAGPEHSWRLERGGEGTAWDPLLIFPQRQCKLTEVMWLYVPAGQPVGRRVRRRHG